VRFLSRFEKIQGGWRALTRRADLNLAWATKKSSGAVHIQRG